MKSQSGKTRGANPAVCSDSDRTPNSVNRTLKGKAVAKSSSRPTFNVKASANKKKLALAKGSKRKNKRIDGFSSSTSLNYNAPSTSQQVVVSPKYQSMEKEASNQYVRLTGPMKAVASGQTKIYSTPPNAPMAKKGTKQRKKTIATSTGGRKFKSSPMDNSQQIVKISDYDSSPNKGGTKSSRNITSLSKVEMRNKKKAYDDGCDQPASPVKQKVDSKAAIRTKSPGKSPRASTSARPQYTKSSTRKDPNDEMISNQSKNDYQKITVEKAKSRSKIPSRPNSGVRSGVTDDCDPPQLIASESGQQGQAYMYNKGNDRPQMVGTSGKMLSERQGSIKVICQKDDHASDSSMTGATSSQAVNAGKVFYQEPREIPGFETTDSDNVYEITEISDINKDPCVPEEPEEYFDTCKLHPDIDDNVNEIVEADAINCPQGRKYYKEKSETREEMPQPDFRQPSICKDKNALGDPNSIPREINPQFKFPEQSGGAQPYRNEKVVCKDKAGMDSRSQYVGQTQSKDGQRRSYSSNRDDSTKYKGDTFIGQTSSEQDLKKKKIVCKDKNETRPKDETDLQSSRPGSPLQDRRGKTNGRDRTETDARGKSVCKDKSQGQKVKGDRSPKAYASKETAVQPDRKSKVVCKDGKEISSNALKSESSKSSFLGLFGRSNDKSKERSKSQGPSKSTPSKKKAAGMSRERKILYGTAAVAILLVLGGLGLYYWNILDFD